MRHSVKNQQQKLAISFLYLSNSGWLSDNGRIIFVCNLIPIFHSQGWIQDLKLGGGGALKKIAPSGGRRENCWGISCEKSRFYAKNHIFSNFRGARAGCAPPGPTPANIWCYIMDGCRSVDISYIDEQFMLIQNTL